MRTQYSLRQRVDNFRAIDRMCLSTEIILQQNLTKESKVEARIHGRAKTIGCHKADHQSAWKLAREGFSSYANPQGVVP